MEISKNRSATARKSSEQPRQDTAKTALITPLRSLYSFIFPHQSSRHGIALFRPLGSIRALVALFRPLGSIRALAPAMCSLRCAHTPTQPPYFAIAPYGLLSSRGCATLTPGCILAPLQGALFPLAESTTPAPRASIPPRQINNTRAAGVHSPSPNQQHPRRGRPFPLAIYGEGVADRPGVRSESSTLALSQPSRSRNRGLFSCRS